MSNGGYSPDEYVLDSSGQPIRDRYGRPVRKRAAATGRSAAERTGSQAHQSSSQQAGAQQGGAHRAGNQSASQSARSAQRRDQRSDQPQQYFPPQSTHPQAQQYRPAGQYQSSAQNSRAARPQQQPPRPASYGPGAQRRHGTSNASARQYSAGSRPQQYATPRPGRKQRRGGCLRWVGWFLVIFMVLSAVAVMWMDSRLQRVDATPATSIPNTKGTNWLLVGSDSRDGFSEADAERLGTGGDIGSMRTDTIMLLHIPSWGGKATLVSLPRDSYVSIPGYGEDKINAAYAYGGAPLLVETVEQATNLHIDRYAEIGMGGLANVVDAIGGIEVCPEEPIDDPLANLTISAGCQKIDGPTALGYVRTRATSNGDLDRVERQREFMGALTSKAASLGTFLNPIRMLRLMNAVPASIAVGEGDHIWNLARIGLAMGTGMETTTVPVGGFASYDVGDVVLWDEQGAAELFDSLR